MLLEKTEIRSQILAPNLKKGGGPTPLATKFCKTKALQKSEFTSYMFPSYLEERYEEGGFHVKDEGDQHIRKQGLILFPEKRDLKNYYKYHFLTIPGSQVHKLSSMTSPRVQRESTL
jgi:hypothetical protein